MYSTLFLITKICLKTFSYQHQNPIVMDAAQSNSRRKIVKTGKVGALAGEGDVVCHTAKQEIKFVSVSQTSVIPKNNISIERATKFCIFKMVAWKQKLL